MEDLMKTSRAVHMALVAASTTLLLFALASQGGINEYELAYKEINSIQLAFAEMQKIEAELCADFHKDNNVLNELLLRVPNVDISNLQFEEGGNFEISDIPLQTIYNKIRYRSVRDNMGGNGDFIQRTRFSVSKDTAKSIIDSSIQKLSNLSSLNTFRINMMSMGEGVAQIEITLSGYTKEQGKMKDINISLIASATSQITDGIGLETADQIFHKNGLITQKSSNDETLPRLSPFWPEISELNLYAAKRTLIRKENEQKNYQGNLKIFGLAVSPKLAIFGGPLLIISTLLILIAHVSHSYLLILNDNNDKVSCLRYPWIALYPSRLSISLTFISLILLPITATLWLIFSFSPHPPYILATIYLVVHLSIGRTLYINIKQLRGLASQRSTTNFSSSALGEL